jgi:hypothetical protein
MACPSIGRAWKTPGAILPAREQLGELLMELKQPAAALREVRDLASERP